MHPLMEMSGAGGGLLRRRLLACCEIDGQSAVSTARFSEIPIDSPRTLADASNMLWGQLIPASAADTDSQAGVKHSARCFPRDFL